MRGVADPNALQRYFLPTGVPGLKIAHRDEAPYREIFPSVVSKAHHLIYG
jgi:hypothetical protein